MKKKKKKNGMRGGGGGQHTNSLFSIWRNKKGKIVYVTFVILG